MSAQKLEPIRWTVEVAAAEFGLDRRTLGAGLRRAGIEPGEDGKFSTKQVCAVVFGDIEAEKLRKTREEADNVALKNQALRGTLVETEAVYRLQEGIFVAFRQKILASSLMDEEKDEILNDLSRLKVRNTPKPSGD